METNIEETLYDVQNKKTIERSAAYPAITIEEAFRFVSELYRNFRNSFAKRSDILSLVENSHPRHIAAAAYYLLVIREKDTYQVSDFYKSIASPISETEKRKNLLKAFEAPKLNKELIDKFDGDEIPKELKIHLSRFHKITEDAAPLAADTFIKNAKFCGVLDDNYVLNFKKAVLSLSEPLSSKPDPIKNDKHEDINSKKEDNLEENKQPVEISLIESKQPKLLEEIVNKEEIKIKLTGRRFAYLIFPDNLNKTDVAILQKQVEQLELIAE